MASEKVAETMWCPFKRALDFDRCIASSCMAWRWDRELNDQLLEDARAAWHEDPGTKTLAESKLMKDAMNDRSGYCGLAGKDD